MLVPTDLFTGETTVIWYRPCGSMISDPKVIVGMDEVTDPIQNDQDPEADSEEEHITNESGAGGEHPGTGPMSAFSTAKRSEEEEKEEKA